MNTALRALPSQRSLAIALSVATAALSAVVVARTLGMTWWPVFDDASIWLRTWDVGGPHTPLVGPHSRFGWNHPGPLLYYVLAPLLRAFDGMPSALLAGALLISLLGAVGVAVLAAYRAGPPAALVLGAGTALLGVGYGDRLIEPWNPYVVLLPLALFMVAAWLIASGEAAALPVAALAGSFAGQSHLGSLFAVLLLGASALLLDRFFPVPGRRRDGDRKWQRLALALLVLLWLPPFADQLLGAGNVSRIGYWAVTDTPGEPPVGLGRGVLMAARQLVPWGPLVGNEPPMAFDFLAPGAPWEVAACLAPALLALALALRFKDAIGLRLALVGFVGLLASVVGTAQIRGTPAAYLTLWTRAVAMLVLVSPLVVLARRYASALGAHTSLPLSAALAATLAAAPIAVRAGYAEFANASLSRAHEMINPLAVGAVRPGDTVRVIGVGSPFTSSAHGILVGLERAGRVGKMLPLHAAEVGEHRIARDDVVLPMLHLTMGPAADRPFDGSRARLVGRYDPRAVETRAEVAELRDKLEYTLRMIQRDDLILKLYEGKLLPGPMTPSALSAEELERFAGSVGGEEKLPWLLVAYRPAPLVRPTRPAQNPGRPAP